MKAFSVFLNDFRDGRTHAELTAKLSELLTAVKNTGKQGELVLRVKVKPASRGDVDKVIITDDVKLTLPNTDRSQDFFWLTDDNEISRNHPRQGALQLRDATDKPVTFKEATKQ